MFISILSWIDDMNKEDEDKLQPTKSNKEKKDKKKGGGPANLWTRCDKCGTVLYIKHLKEKDSVCSTCGSHHLMTSRERIKSLIDRGTWRPLDETLSPCNPLNFCDQKPYNERLQEAQERTQLQDAILTGTGILDTIPVAMGVMDFNFMGGSMGSVVGEKITRLIELATRKGYVLIIICASGGARMQEGILSLMQMAKISAALQIHQSRANLLYLSILTSPTTGGVTASFGMLGDIIIAEPNALIGFAGRRVIEQTLQEELPDDFQTAEYLLDHGLCDLIIPRRFLKGALSEIISMYKDAPFRKRGELPANFQKPFDFLTEEKIRRKFLKNKDDKIFEEYYDYLEASGKFSLLTKFLYADSLKLSNLFSDDDKDKDIDLESTIDEESETIDLDSETIDLESAIDEESETIDLESAIDEESETIDLDSETIDLDSETIDLESAIDEESETIDLESAIDEESEILVDSDSQIEYLNREDPDSKIIDPESGIIDPEGEIIDLQIEHKRKLLIEECERISSIYKEILISLNIKLDL